MELKKISKWFIVIGALFIWVIKSFVRPNYFIDGPIRFFLNISPNLLASFLFPFGIYWFFSSRNFVVPRFLRLENSADLRLVCVTGLGMLIANEYFQLIPFFGRTFDYNDILFSCLGLLVSYFVFSKLQSRQRRNYSSVTH